MTYSATIDIVPLAQRDFQPRSQRERYFCWLVPNQITSGSPELALCNASNSLQTPRSGRDQVLEAEEPLLLSQHC
jgi:hypothetical protein